MKQAASDTSQNIEYFCNKINVCNHVRLRKLLYNNTIDTLDSRSLVLEKFLGGGGEAAQVASPREANTVISLQKKPFTAVTAQIDNLTTEAYDENDVSGIPDLCDAIRLQDSGPTEASRAIRKKL